MLMNKYIKNNKNLKIYWEKSPKSGVSTHVLKHSSFVIFIRENRSLLDGDDHASVTQLFSYQVPQRAAQLRAYDLTTEQREELGKKFLNTDYAQRVVEGKPDLVFNEMLLRLGAAKEEFVREWKKAKYRDFIKRGSNRARYYNPFDLGSPSKKISEQLVEQNISIPELTKRLKETNDNTTYENVFNQVRGNRKITHDQAIKYSKILNIDPAELLFDDLQTHVWGKVDLLKANELEDIYDPGRIFSYYTKIDDAQVVTVPRNIWRPDIMAIRVSSPGSMYNNQVAFYYKSKVWSKAFPNQLCVMAFRHTVEEMGIDETHYYFGLYEEVRGQANLINPDPFRKKEYILQNCKPEWTSPIVAMVNPGLVKKSKITTDIVKEHSAIQEKHTEEEKYKLLLDRIKKDVMNIQKNAKDSNKKLKEAIEQIKNFKEQGTKIKDSLYPDIFRREQEQIKHMREKLLSTVDEHFDDEDKVA